MNKIEEYVLIHNIENIDDKLLGFGFDKDMLPMIKLLTAFEFIQFLQAISVYEVQGKEPKFHDDHLVDKRVLEMCFAAVKTMEKNKSAE